MNCLSGQEHCYSLPEILQCQSDNTILKINQPVIQQFIVTFLHGFVGKLCLLMLDRENLKDKESQAQQHRQQISEACGENDYNTTREHIRDSIATLQE